MIKVVAILKRKPGMSIKEYRDFCLTEDLKHATKMPGLIKFSHTFVDEQLQGQLDIDGFVELWFENKEVMEAAFASKEGKACVSLEPQFLDTQALNVYLTQEHAWPNSII